MLAVEVDLDELAEAAAIIIPRGFGVSEGLHDRVRGEHFLLDLGHLRGSAHIGEVAHCVLGAHCLACAGLAGHNDRLVLAEVDHFLESHFRHGEYVRVHVLHVPAIVRLDYLVAVDGQLLVGVDRHQDYTAVSVDLVAVYEAHLEVVEDLGLVQVAEGCKVVLADQDVRVAQGRQLRIRHDC